MLRKSEMEEIKLSYELKLTYGNILDMYIIVVFLILILSILTLIVK